MELCASVCTNLARKYAVSPIAAACVVRRSDRAHTLPLTTKRKAPKRVELVALSATSEAGAHWLVRGAGSLFGGMWSCPSVEGKTRADAVALAQSLGLAGRLARKSQGKVEHVLTHRRMQVEVFALQGAHAVESESMRAVSAAELDTLGISKLTRKILALQGNHSRLPKVPMEPGRA